MATSIGALKIRNFYIDFSQTLGKGSTGNVYKATNTETNEPLAVKMIKMSNVKGEVAQYLLDSEKKALKAIKSPYIIKVYDVIQLKDQCLIVTQFCSKGSLKDYITKRGKLSSSEAFELFKKILTGYITISQALFIHRDLKTANILLRGNGEPVIIDFGYCQMMMSKKPLILYNVGSPSYMAPQVYTKSRYSEKSDIWSLGVILYEMLTGKTLDYGIDDIHVHFRTIQKQGKVRMSIEGISSVCKQLLQKSLQVNPQNRATCHKLKYIIDKSLIPEIQSQLNRVLGTGVNRNSQSFSRIRHPTTYFKYGESNLEPTLQQFKRDLHQSERMNIEDMNDIRSRTMLSPFNQIYRTSQKTQLNFVSTPQLPQYLGQSPLKQVVQKRLEKKVEKKEQRKNIHSQINEKIQKIQVMQCQNIIKTGNPKVKFIQLGNNGAQIKNHHLESAILAAESHLKIK